MGVMSEIDGLVQLFRQRERELERALGEARRIMEEGRRAKEEVARLEERETALQAAAGVLASFADQRQAEVQAQVEGLVTHGLRAVFGPDITFEIRTSTRGRLAASDFVVTTTLDGERVETSILDARGGGVAAVAGFLLRLVILLLRQDARPALLLDESFAQLSAEYEPKMADVLRELVDRTRAQVVLVTHSDAYSDQADIVYRTRLDAGQTKVERIG